MQADNVTKETELNGMKDGKLPEQTQPAAHEGGADVSKLEEEGLVLPEGQGAAKAAEEYLGAPLPANEKERHDTLCACQILDSAPDPRFDDITKLVRCRLDRNVPVSPCINTASCTVALAGRLQGELQTLLTSCIHMPLQDACTELRATVVNSQSVRQAPSCLFLNNGCA